MTSARAGQLRPADELLKNLRHTLMQVPVRTTPQAEVQAEEAAAEVPARPPDRSSPARASGLPTRR